MVRKCIPVPMLRHVEAALVSAVFNIGPAVVCGSTLQGRWAMANDWPGACAQLSRRWDKAAGRHARADAAKGQTSAAFAKADKFRAEAHLPSPAGFLAKGVLHVRRNERSPALNIACAPWCAMW